ncbi:MAG: hypothetical protein ACLFTO_05360 [Candidatus Acetothermia bacterium]
MVRFADMEKGKSSREAARVSIDVADDSKFNMGFTHIGSFTRRYLP